MNLLERLRKDIMDKLESNDCPYISKNIMDTLRNHKFISDVPYGIFFNMKYFINIDTDPHEMFD